MKKTMMVLAVVLLSSFAVHAQETSGKEPAKEESGTAPMGPGMMGGGGMGAGMMDGGYGMGRGMMRGGGYGMGQGMIGGYYAHSPECQAFYHDTAKLRKEYYDKQFEYYETMRNPKATGETATRLSKELEALYGKIYAKTPLGCMW